MELERAFYSRSPRTTEKIPLDVNASGDLFAQQRWYSNLGISQPVFYGIQFLNAFVFGILLLVFGIIADDVINDQGPFWDLLSELISVGVTAIITALAQFGLQPVFWRRRAREMIEEGYFNTSTRNNGRRRLVLEIGCNEGKTSATLARAIIERQRDVGNMLAPHPSLPVFIGYDRWNPWSRIPNTPACFLSTLLQAGVPRECIIANRMDTTSDETKTQLPYSSGSISLIICNIGLSELVNTRVKRGKIFQELVRVLEPGGRMVIVEGGCGEIQKSDKRRFESPKKSYKRILVDGMGWPEENVLLRRSLLVGYLVGIKPSGTRENV